MPPPPQPQQLPPGAAEGPRGGLVERGGGGRGSAKRQSRVLWDAVLRPQQQPSKSRWHLHRWSSLARAILYEVQPIRCSEALDLTRSATQKTHGTLQWLLKLLQCLPQHSIAVWKFLCQHLTLRRSGIIVGIVGYYWFVRYLHEWLEAGPMVLIITAMVGIFTVGLRDDEDRQGLSAYSVFNRGFQRIMGSIDAEELVQQHVGAAGGGLMAFAMAPQLHRQGGDDNDNHERGQQRRQRRDVPAIADDHNNEPLQQQPHGDGGGGGQEQGGGGARKTGKKARRRNLEQRRELRRQREAAMAMGFGEGNNDLQELLAMQRLMEEDDHAD